MLFWSYFPQNWPKVDFFAIQVNSEIHKLLAQAFALLNPQLNWKGFEARGKFQVKRIGKSDQVQM